jgi:hypothetical protein
MPRTRSSTTALARHNAALKKYSPSARASTIWWADVIATVRTYDPREAPGRKRAPHREQGGRPAKRARVVE